MAVARAAANQGTAVGLSSFGSKPVEEAAAASPPDLLAYLWGLAANGQAGVENMLDTLRGGIDSALLGLGKASIRDLTPSDLVVPPGFTRTRGGDGPAFDSVLDGQPVTG